MENNFIALFADILEMNSNEIHLNDNFRKYENWGSLSYLSTIAMMDEDFNIQIETKVFKTLLTVGDLVHVVTKK